MQRRQFLQSTLAAAAAAQRLLSEPSPSYLESTPDMLYSHLAGKLNALAEKWDRERARIHEPAEITSRNQFVREKVREMLGNFPARNPLGAKVVRSRQKQGYRVENVMFQSRPGFWVTGNLYIPGGRGPFPAVLSPCGHYPLARTYPDYQLAYLNL